MPNGSEARPVHEAALSPARAVLIGHLVVTVPVVAITLLSFVPLILLKNVFWGLVWVFLQFVIAWLWWSLTIPLWRDWAKGRGANQNETQILAVRSGLVWPKGCFLEKTEIRIRKKN